MQKFAAAKKMTKHLKSFSIALAIFALLFPHFSGVPILALMLLPWVAIALMAWAPGRYQIMERHDDIRPDLALLFIVSSLVLRLLAGGGGIMLLQMTDALVFATISAIALTGLIFYLGRFARRRYWVLFFFLLLNGGYGYSTFVLANTKLDHSVPQMYQTMVTKKTDLHDKTYKLMLAPWGEQTQMQSVWVSRAVYDGVATGGNACILFHPGALRMPWYQVVPCIN
ncbi:hypothetical protein ACO0LC_11020 [Undibacterium sp. JH2W]|uniref:hypothetical protein n=1 Tax=Undibacterium sp. JH2W TaxID=3413037 RepID=UPI003BEF746C